VAMVWPCPLPVDAYIAAGRRIEFPRPDCPLCAGPMTLWSGYWRHVRAAGRCRKVFVSRLRCGRCRVSHALLPAFVLAWRLDVAETVGAVIAEVAGGGCGVRPAAARAGVPHTTARGWVRRFRVRAGELGTAFAALAVELGGDAVRPPAEAARFALAGIGAAFGAAAGLPGGLAAGVWRFASSVSGGRLIAANTTSPYLIAGTRRFMPPVPP
jgi:transposase-like protein